ncbi:MAG: hypothetical protein V1804_03040 [Patescibacteria group bacterium]
MKKKKLLINFVYYRPVGHVVEALKYAKGYYEANNNKLDIYLLLNADSPIELAEACYWIKKTYPISLSDMMKRKEKSVLLKNVPKIWDYIISDHRVNEFKAGWDENDLIETQKILQNYFIARIKKGITPKNVLTTYPIDKLKKSQTLPYKFNQPISIPIPTKSKKFIQKYKHNGLKICIMLGGSAGEIQSPSIKMWLKICQALFHKFKNLRIYFTGITESTSGRTKTVGFAKKDVEYLIKNLPLATDCYNIGFWNQLALIQMCDIFLSPHTGFAFLAPTVGTPWLALSNCRWQEYLFNELPFYSVLPSCGYYPAQENITEGCGKRLANNKKCLCMNEKNLATKIPDVVKGAKLLFDNTFTYEKAMKLHINKIKKNDLYDFNKFFFFDGPSVLKKSIKIK